MRFMQCKINSEEDNARLAEVLGNLDPDDYRIMNNAYNEAYQTGIDRTGVVVFGTMFAASVALHYIGNAILKKRLNK
ncbi:MAG: hypothetical protein J6U54_11245 [Clostridiales bacterium]|nr:hypothetical protein [Clostridiales bacterium]